MAASTNRLTVNVDVQGSELRLTALAQAIRLAHGSNRHHDEVVDAAREFEKYLLGTERETE